MGFRGRDGVTSVNSLTVGDGDLGLLRNSSSVASTSCMHESVCPAATDFFTFVSSTASASLDELVPSFAGSVSLLLETSFLSH